MNIQMEVVTFAEFQQIDNFLFDCKNPITRVCMQIMHATKIECSLFLFLSEGRTNFSLADTVKTGIRLFLRRKILPGVVGSREPRLARRSAQNF